MIRFGSTDMATCDSLFAMSKSFHAWDTDRIWLLPLSVPDLVPYGRMAHLARETVWDVLDLASIMECCEEDRGYLPYPSGRDGGAAPLRLQPGDLLLVADREGV